MKEYIKSVISISLIMIPVIIFGTLGMTIQMLISLFAGFASAVMLNIERFKSFKAGQLEATLIEAKEFIEEASATVEQLKEVAEPLFNTNLVSLAYDGYFDGMNVDDKVKVFANLIDAENKLELNSDLTKGLVKKTKKAIAYHLFRDIGDKIDVDELSAETIFFSKYSIETEKAFATIEEVENYFQENPHLKNAEVKKAVEKFKDFIKNYY